MSISPGTPLVYQELRARLAKVHDLERVKALLEWDMRTTMPEGGASARVEQIASVERSRHERLTANDVGRLFEEVRSYEETLDPASEEACLIRTGRRDYEKACAVSASLNGRLARAEARGQRIWTRAREESDFGRLLPFLEEVVDLKREYISCFDVAEPYDALLDDFEPGLTTSQISRLLTELRIELVPLVAELAGSADSVDNKFLHGYYPKGDQRVLCQALLSMLPIDGSICQLGESAHPVSTGIALGDVRITTRYDERDLPASIFPVLHEFGHALYESNIDPEFERTPLAEVRSLGLHESQSRIWENPIGRSHAFWRFFFPYVEGAFPEQLRGVDLDRFHRAVNAVEPSLIRVEADEVTYDLHIILRFELEHELFAGTLEPRDLPDAWNAKVESYLGLQVPDDRSGVLQDLHWAEGAFGYFPTYSLGNVIAGQLWEEMNERLPGLEEQIERGEFTGIRDWLRENVHRHGRKLSATEVVKQATGGPIQTGPYLRYLHQKVEQVHGLAAGSAR